MMQQVVGDLRTLVTRRVGVGKRVALLANDRALAQALEANKCQVLVDPASHQELAEFHPSVVVAFDGLLAEGERGLDTLRPVLGDADLILSFANAASARAVIDASTGGPLVTAWSAAQVRAWLRANGYVVHARDVVVGQAGPSKLSADTEAALRQVLEQLNPEAAVDRYLVVAKRGLEASPVEWVEGLTSVIVTGGTDVAALQGTIRSVLGQLLKPFELVVVSPLFETQLEDLTSAGKGRAGVTVVLMPGVEGDALALTNRALERATGQYVCCLEAGELLDRTHLEGLVQALRDGTNAWALSAGVEPSPLFDVKARLEAGDVQRGRYVLDRSRLGRFALTFAEGVAQAEAMFFVRLAAIFPPTLVGLAPTLDSPRVLDTDVKALLEVMRARPLRTLVEVREVLAPREVSLVDQVQERLEQRSVRGGQWFARARALSERVVDAAVKAREAAKRELDGE